MIKRLRFVLITLLFCSLLSAFFACTKAPENESGESGEEEQIVVDYASIASIEVAEAAEYEETGFLLSEFSMSLIKLIVTYQNEEQVEIPASYSMVRAEDKAKLSVAGTHNITLYYGKFTVTFRLRLFASTEMYFRVTFMDWEGNRIGDVQYLKSGQIASVPNLDTRDGYEFIGWMNPATGSIVTSFTFTTDTTLVANYAPEYYTVQYYFEVGGNPEIIGSSRIKRGEDAYDYAPEIPVIEGYSNGHWSDREGMKNVDSENLRFYAVYDRDSVNATFVYYKYVEGEWYSYDVYYPVADANPGIEPPDDVNRTSNEIFLYWYILHGTEEVRVTFPYVLTAETVFYAKYVPVEKGSDGLQMKYFLEKEGEEFRESGRVIADYCSEKSVFSSDQTKLDVTFCDCNVFGLLEDSSVSAENVSDNLHSSVSDDVCQGVDVVDASFSALLSSVDLSGSNYRQISASGGSDVYNAFYNVYTDAKNVFGLANTVTVKRIEDNVSDSAVIGITSPYVITADSSAYSDRAVLVRTVARLFGGNDTDSFCAHANAIASHYRSRIDSFDGTLAEKRAYLTGAIYSAGDSFVLPFAFGSNQLSASLLCLVYVGADGNVCVWVNNLADAFVAANINDTDPGANAFTLDVKARCVLFEKIDRQEGYYITAYHGSDNTIALPVKVEFTDVDRNVFVKRDTTAGDALNGTAYVTAGNHVVLSRDETALKGKTYYDRYFVEIHNGEYYTYLADNPVVGDPIPAGKEYYVPAAHGYVLTTDTIFEVGTTYYLRRFFIIRNSYFYLREDSFTDGDIISQSGYYYLKDNNFIPVPAGTTYNVRLTYFIRVGGLTVNGTQLFVEENRTDATKTYFVPQNYASIKGLMNNPFVDNGAERFYVANGNTVFRINNDALYSADLKTLYAYPTNKATSTWPVQGNEVSPTTISDYAFYGAKNLTDVRLPGSVRTIGAHAFEGSGIGNIVLPESVVKLGDYCFADAYNIESLTFAENSQLRSIGAFCFSGLYKLESMTLPITVEEIGRGVFDRCTSLSQINLDNAYFTVDKSNGGLYGRKETIQYYYLYAFPAKYTGSSNGVVTINPGARIVLKGAFSYAGLFEIAFESVNNSLVFENGSVVCPTLKTMRFNCTAFTLDRDVFLDEREGSVFLPESFYFHKDKADGLEALLDPVAFSQITVVRYESTSEYREYKTFYDNFGYEVISSSGELFAYITAYRGIEKELTVPELLNNATVVAILPDAFRGNNAIEVLELPDTVETIGNNAFYGCQSLRSVSFGSALTTLGDNVFASCPKLETVTADERTRILHIGSTPFVGTKFIENRFAVVGGVLFKYNGFDDSISVPDNVYIITDYAFYGCTSISKLVFGTDSQLTEVGNYAFFGCENLTEVVLPASVRKIGDASFASCAHLFAVVFTGPLNHAYPTDAFDSTATVYGIPSCHVFESNAASYEYLFTGSITGQGYYVMRAPDAIVDGSVFEGWFLNDSYSEQAVFPMKLSADTTFYGKYTEEEVGSEGLTYALVEDGYEVTGYTGSKKHVTIPSQYNGKRVVSIAKRAFFGKDIAYFYLPETVKHVGRDAFTDTTWINGIIEKNVVLGSFLIKYNGFALEYSLPTEVKYLADGAFSDNTRLVTFELGNNVTVIPEECFSGCTSLKTVRLNKNVTEIAAKAFKNSFSLETLDYSMAKHLRNIHYSAFDGSRFRAQFPDDSLVINDVFYAYLGSNYTVHIPNTVTIINPYAFYGNTHIKYVYVPESTVTIGDYAFAESALEKIFFAGTFTSLTTVGERAFYRCSSAVDYNFRICDKLKSIGKEAFAGVRNKSGDDLLTFYVPEKVDIIGERAFASSDVYAVYFSDGSKLTEIQKESFMDCDKLVSIRFMGESALDSIGDKAFFRCESLRTFINDRADIRSIGTMSFFGCAELTVFGINESNLTVIGVDAFTGSPYIADDTMVYIGAVLMKYNGIQNNVYIPEKTTQISNNAFDGNERVSTVVFTGSNIAEIQRFAFRDCVSLIDINLPGSLQKIEYGAFAGCSSLVAFSLETDGTEGFVSIDGVLFRYYQNGQEREAELFAYPGGHAVVYSVPDSVTHAGLPYAVTSIAEYAFYNMSALTRITMPNSVKKIGNYAFAGCVALETVNLGSGIDEIGEGAFASCDSLKKVYTSGTLDAWCGITFGDETADPMCFADNLYVNNAILSGDIVLPETITKIPSNTFKNSAITSITIQIEVVEIGKNAFKNCSGLTDIWYAGGVNDWSRTIVFGSDWDSGTGSFTIHCSDGDIVK